MRSLDRTEARKGLSDDLELELQVVVSSHVGTENETQVLSTAKPSLQALASRSFSSQYFLRLRAQEMMWVLCTELESSWPLCACV